MLKILLILFLDCLLTLINGQVDTENFRQFMGRKMNDENWKKLISEMKKQSHYCKTGMMADIHIEGSKWLHINTRFNLSLDLESYLGFHHPDFPAHLATLLKGHHVMLNDSHFIIHNEANKRVLEANQDGINVNMVAYDGNERQHWKVEQYQSISSKAFPSLVLTINVTEYWRFAFGEIYLKPYEYLANQQWNLNKLPKILSYVDNLRLDVNAKDGRVGVYKNSEYFDYPTQDWSMSLETETKFADYFPENFASFMEEKMTDNSWYTLLTDLDDQERQCRIGFMGAYHVDFPQIMNLSVEETVIFYLKKAQMYQGTPKTTHKGPLSTFMSSIIDGRGWAEILLYYNQMMKKCQHLFDINEFNEYLTTEANQTKYTELKDYLFNELERYWTETLETTEDFARFINQHLDDNGWKKLIKDVKRMSDDKCSKNLRDQDIHFNWAFHAGITNEPVKAHQMYSYITKVINNEPIHFL